MADTPQATVRDHVLPGDLSLAAAPSLKDALGALLAAGTPCRLDAGVVATVSTAALQILLAATRGHRHVTIGARSPVLEQAIADLGLTDDFAPQGDSNG